MTKASGYLTSVVGALLGAAAMGALLGWAGAALGSGGLDSVGMMAVGVVLGAYAGCVLGAWRALRGFRLKAANATAIVLAALAPIGIGAGIRVGIRADGRQATFIAVLLSGVAVSTVAARVLGQLLGDDARGDGAAALRGPASTVTDRPDPPPYEAEQPFGPPR